ncbi:haloacid dehalogenase type II [Rubrobacter aplysinae]|uniref:haloacid dehalogenase type II n=1 Tax=Rubrobacter aplysinae TaxID=909625 RepID=UPI00064C4824|nr:haloacid dehalogenase type II [Rubrobacter aplysinae]
MPHAIGFDIYGTLVDPLEMTHELRALAGDRAERMSELWRQKQIEYALRRGLMRDYQSFGVCTAQALRYAAEAVDVELPEAEERRLLEEYQNLRAFADVGPALEKMKADGHRMVAFSNGVEETARTLLERAGILDHLGGMVSVDDLGTFKPDPRVYEYLAQRLQSPVEQTWLVSSNPWDVIGAKTAGLRAAWIRRSPEAVFDPWEVEPDLVAGDLLELSRSLSPAS